MKNQNQKLMETYIKVVEMEVPGKEPLRKSYTMELPNLSIILDFMAESAISENLTFDVNDLRTIAEEHDFTINSRGVKISIRILPLVDTITVRPKDTIDHLLCDAEEVCENSFINSYRVKNG